MDITTAIHHYPWLGKILHELPPEQLERIKIRQYKPQETIIEHCETNYYTYIILEGICYSLQNTKNGTKFTLRKSTIGDVIGFMNVYQEEMDFEARITARTKVTAALLPKPLMQTCFGTCHDFSIQMSERVMKRLQALITLLSECNNYPSYLSLVTYLEYNYLFYLKSYPDHYSGPVRIMEGRQNIADFLGINVRSVQRLLVKMKDEQLISISSRSIYIDRKQYDALQELHHNWLP